MLRRAAPDDAPRLAEVAEAAYRHYVARAGVRPAPMDADYGRAIREDETWVLEIDGVLLGFVVLRDEGDTLLLDNVAVDPPAQGRGHGGRLLDLAERRAVELGCRAVRLYTHVTMVENQRIYRSRGYVETERSTGPWARVFYRLSLAPAGGGGDGDAVTSWTDE